jgi:preprotein translocase SecE subunit
MNSPSRYMYVVFIATAFLTGWAMRAAAVSGLLMAEVDDTVFLGIVSISGLIGLASGVLAFFGLLRSTKAVTYVNEVIGEMVKVTWPTREETTNNSITVIIVSLIFSGSLALFDLVWAQVTEYVFVQLS